MTRKTLMYHHLVPIQYEIYTNKTTLFNAEFCQCVKNYKEQFTQSLQPFIVSGVVQDRVMKVQTQQILHKMRAHTFCSDTESNLTLFTYNFVIKGIKSSVLLQDS